MTSSSIRQNSLTAHSWWLASEIARRHKNLELVTCVETQGLDETLGIFDKNSCRLLAFFSDETPNRAVVDGNAKPAWAFGWDMILGMSARDAVTTVERQLMINVPNHALSTTEKTLVYRLLAKLIATKIWSRDTWRAFSCSYYDAQDQNFIPSDALDEFPSAIDKFELTHGRGGLAPAPDGFWLIYKNGNSVAAFDEDGFVHFPDDRPTLSLMPRFDSLQRKVDALAVDLDGELMAVGR